MEQSLTHLSLCSGIGGLDLAAEWAGFRTIGQCEIDDYASKVLAKNFKGVPNFHDIRTITAERLAEHGIDPGSITVVSAGIPCQPYSLAGKGLGDLDERDLEQEYMRVIGELRPKWAIIENTPGLFARKNQRYFRRILDDFTALGYSVAWGMWGAGDVGAPHERQRIFVVAYSDGKRWNILKPNGNIICQEMGGQKDQTEAPFGAGSVYGKIPDSYGDTERRLPFGAEKAYALSGNVCEYIPDADCKWKLQSERGEQNFGRRFGDSDWWQVEPDVGRVANGISSRVDRLKCLGNAVVPYQAYPIFDVIAEIELSGERK